MNSKNSQVSVIIPTYNRAGIIDRSITSVLNQTFSDFELLIIDDHSIDNTKALIETIGKKDSRVRYIFNNGKQGPGASRNLGIKNARGEFIAFLDSDDAWKPGHLERNITFISNHEVDFIFSDMITMKGDSVLSESTFKEHGFLKNYKAVLVDEKNNFYFVPDNRAFMKQTFLKGMGIMKTPTLFFRKSSLNAFFYEDIMAYEDDLFFLENLMRNISVGFINEINFIIHISDGSLSNPEIGNRQIRREQFECKGREYFYNKYKNELDFSERYLIRYALGNHLNILGNCHYSQNDMKEAVRFYVKAIAAIPSIYMVKTMKITMKLVFVLMKMVLQFNTTKEN